jgi:hypothetical protein
MPTMQTLDADHACGAGTGLPGRACGHGQLETQHLREILTSSGYADSGFGVPPSHKKPLPADVRHLVQGIEFHALAAALD